MDFQTGHTHPEAPFSDGALGDAELTASELLVERKKAILRAQRRATKAMLALFQEVSEFLEEPPVDDPATFLRTECNISRSDLDAYREYREAILPSADVIIQNRVSFDIVKALTGVGPDARQEALRRVATGVPLEASSVRRFEKLKRLNARSPSRVMQDERARRFKRNATSHGQAAIRSLEAEACSLLAAMRSFCEYYDERNMTGAHPVYDNEHCDTDAHARDKVALQDMAGDLLVKFEDIFGSEHAHISDWALVGLKDSAARALAEAHHTLTAIASGKFGFPDPFPGHYEPFYKWSGISAIEYLAGISTRDPYQYKENGLQSDKLSSIELCAGAGGEALGLMAAGFHAVALFDNMEKATNTLKANYPSWNVLKRNLNSKKALVDFKRILKSGSPSLIAGGVPCQPYSTLGKRKGRNDKRELFGTAKDFVKLVSPKAFFFENVKGFTEKNHIAWRQELVGEFEALGYSTQIIILNASEYGLAQHRERIAVIGVLPEYRDALRTPAVKLPGATLRDVVADLAFPDRSRPDQLRDPAWMATRSMTQKDYDDWADHWLREHGHKSSPTVTASLGWQDATRKNKSPQIANWKAVGIDITVTGDDQVRLGEVSDPTAPIPLTTALAKRLQGFPDGWIFDGTKRDQLKQIGNALPPVMARAVGLAIHDALTGQCTDIAKALTSVLIRPDRIGKREPYSTIVARHYSKTEQALAWKDYILNGNSAEDYDAEPVKPTPRARRMLPPPIRRDIASTASTGTADSRVPST